jgi:hypothetical protein
MVLSGAIAEKITRQLHSSKSDMEKNGLTQYEAIVTATRSRAIPAFSVLIK